MCNEKKRPVYDVAFEIHQRDFTEETDTEGVALAKYVAIVLPHGTPDDVHKLMTAARQYHLYGT